jgi:hypothetical protein
MKSEIILMGMPMVPLSGGNREQSAAHAPELPTKYYNDFLLKIIDYL